MRNFSVATLTALFALSLAGCGQVATTATQRFTTTTIAAKDAAPTHKVHLYAAVEILGIGPVYAERLKAVGIRQASDLLEAGHTRNGRAKLAEATGISPKLILTWVNHADLIRVIGTGPVYARMLEDAGVDTVAELATRNPHNLREALEFVRERGGKTLVERVPSVTTVSEWIRRANDLGGYVKY
jgi:predicted flap endonuclease-1-like 5' DNA nuclease